MLALSADPGLTNFSTSAELEDQIVKFLLLLDYDASSGGSTTAEALLLTSPTGKNLLHLSSALGFHILVAELIRRGVPLEERDANGYTALHLATLCGKTSCTRVLVEAGADSNTIDGHNRVAQDHTGEPVYDEAIENGESLETSSRDTPDARVLDVRFSELSMHCDQQHHTINTIANSGGPSSSTKVPDAEVRATGTLKQAVAEEPISCEYGSVLQLMPARNNAK